MKSGVRKSGWPMPRLMISRPWATRALARASTAKAFSSPMRSKAGTVFSMGWPWSCPHAPRSCPMHHRRNELFERRRAHLLHHRIRFRAQKLEHALDAVLAEGAEAPDIGPADAYRTGADAQGLNNIGAAAETTVDDNGH